MNESPVDLTSLTSLIIKSRRSSRAFTSEKISNGIIEKILEAGISAPTGSNSQNIRFLVETDPKKLREIGEVRYVWPYPSKSAARKKNPFGIIGNAPTAIFVFSDNSLTDPRNHGERYIWEVMNIQNASAAIENMLLMASACGIGNCWVSAGKRMNNGRLLSGQKWGDILSTGENSKYEIQGIIILGHPRHGLDHNGFPKGERKHGASEFKETNRADITSYLISESEIKRNRSQGWLVKYPLRSLQKLAYTVIRILDKVEYWIIGR